jgi:predicted amidohydrolase YtcJ
VSGADLILAGGVVRSGHDGWRPHEALALAGGRVAAAGSRADVAALAGPATEELDLGGGCALPGLTDAHVHIFGYGLSLELLPAGEAGSLEELGAMVGAAAAEAPGDGWIVGHGWDHERWPGRRMPDRRDLDAASGGRPVYLTRTCSHIAVASSAALARAGVSRDMPDPPGGVIDRGPDGEPTGVLRETALPLVGRLIPPPGPSDRARLLARALRQCLSLGITQVQTDDLGIAGGLEAGLDLFRSVAGPGGVPVRITLMLPIDLFALAQREGMGTGWGDEWLRIGHVKVFADGSLGGRTAALREPYSDAPGVDGVLVQRPDELREICRRVHSAGSQLGIHAIGDRAAHLVIDAVAAAVAKRPRPGHRHRLIHCQITGPDTLEAMRAAGMTADLQTGFLASDAPWVTARIGRERAATSYAWGTILGLGIPACGGSDAPIDPLDPMRGIASAVTRAGAPPELARPAERLTVAQALGLYTHGAAAATFEEGRRGTLAPGMAGDVTVLDRDPFEAAPEELAGLRCRATVLAGRVAERGLSAAGGGAGPPRRSRA